MPKRFVFCLYTYVYLILYTKPLAMITQRGIQITQYSSHSTTKILTFNSHSSIKIWTFIILGFQGKVHTNCLLPRSVYWRYQSFVLKYISYLANAAFELYKMAFCVISGKDLSALGVSDWLLFYTNTAIFLPYHGENKLNFQWDDDEVRFVLDQPA